MVALSLLLLFGAVIPTASYLYLMARRDLHEPPAATPGELLERARLAARYMRLTEIHEGKGLFARPQLRGRSGALGVQIDAWRQGDATGPRILVTGLWPGAEGLRVHREGAGSSREIGAPAFDQEFWIEGPAALAFAVLDDPVRWRLADLLRGYVAVEGREPVQVSAWLEGRELEVRIEEDVGAGVLAAVLERALDIAHRLRTPDDIPGRIAANLRSEHEPGVRLRCVLLLARELPQHPATREALLAVRQDPYEEVRLQAGWFLGEEGRSTLLALVGSERTEDSCAARAVAALGEWLPTGQAEAALLRALERGRTETARACMEALERRDGLTSESLLLRALQSDDSPVAVAAARALGQVGTAAAVVPLREVTPALPGALRSATRQAIAEIQSRLGGSPGELSLAGGEAGTLSLARHGQEPGQLSLSAPEETASAGARRGRTWA